MDVKLYLYYKTYYKTLLSYYKKKAFRPGKTLLNLLTFIFSHIGIQ